MPRTALSQADAAEIVLRDAGRPMHREEITDEILKRGLDVWASGDPGRTPWESVGRAITQEIVQLGHASRFEYERKGSGTYRLRKGAKAEAGARTPAPRPVGAPTSITIDLTEELLAQLDMESRVRGLSREELVRRMVRHRLWELDRKRAEEEWERSYRDDPPGDEDLALARTSKFIAEPWNSAR